MCLQVNIKLFNEKFIQVMSCKDQRKGPENGSHNIIKKELSPIHVHNSGHNGGKCTDYRKKPCHNHSQGTMLFKKIMCLFQIFLFEKETVFRSEERRVGKECRYRCAR